MHQQVETEETDGRQAIPDREAVEVIEQVLSDAFDKYAPFYDTREW